MWSRFPRILLGAAALPVVLLVAIWGIQQWSYMQQPLDFASLERARSSRNVPTTIHDGENNVENHRGSNAGAEGNNDSQTDQENQTNQTNQMNQEDQEDQEVLQNQENYSQENNRISLSENTQEDAVDNTQMAGGSSSTAQSSQDRIQSYQEESEDRQYDARTYQEVDTQSYDNIIQDEASEAPTSADQLFDEYAQERSSQSYDNNMQDLNDLPEDIRQLLGDIEQVTESSAFAEQDPTSAAEEMSTQQPLQESYQQPTQQTRQQPVQQPIQEQVQQLPEQPAQEADLSYRSIQESRTQETQTRQSTTFPTLQQKDTQASMSETTPEMSAGAPASQDTTISQANTGSMQRRATMTTMSSITEQDAVEYVAQLFPRLNNFRGSIVYTQRQKVPVMSRSVEGWSVLVIHSNDRSMEQNNSYSLECFHVYEQG